MPAITNHKILIISYHFPPDSRVGALRPAKMAKYLSKFGWQPYILTIREKDIPLKEYERLKEVRDMRIIRTSVWPNIIQLLLTIRNKLFSFSKRKKNAEYRHSSGSVDSKRSEKTDAGILHSVIISLKRYLVSFLALPDETNGWLIPAMWRGYWLIKKERIRVIMTSSPPATTALIGLFLSRLTGARLLTDLRDPWFLMTGKPEKVRCELSDRVETWLEKQIMEKSDKVITTNDTYSHFLRTHYSFVCKNNFFTLHNGYDPEDFSGLESVQSNGLFTLSYLGTFYLTRTPKEFLCAVSQLINENVMSRHELAVNFIGRVRSANGEMIEDLVKLYGLTGCVTIQDPLPYKQALLQMKKSHVLLLFAPEKQYYSVPGKTFEYIGAEKQILCFGNRGATADFITKTGAGIVVDPHNINEIKNAIKELYLSWKSGRQLTANFDRTVFDRSRLTRELLQLLQP